MIETAGDRTGLGWTRLDLAACLVSLLCVRKTSSTAKLGNEKMVNNFVRNEREITKINIDTHTDRTTRLLFTQYKTLDNSHSTCFGRIQLYSLRGSCLLCMRTPKHPHVIGLSTCKI